MMTSHSNSISSITLEQLTKSPDSSPVYVDEDIAILEDVQGFRELKALRPHDNFVLVCMEGDLKMDINGEPRHIHRHELFFTRSNVIIDNYEISPDFKCRVFCMSNNMLYIMLRSKINVWMEAAYMGGSNIFSLSDKEIELLNEYVSLIKLKLRLKINTMFERETMQSLLQSLLLEFCDILCHLCSSAKGDMPQGRRLFNRFLSMLSGIDTKRHSVKYYADELAVSPKYLNMVCKKYSDQTASKWIEHYLMEDIRYYLKNTQLSIKEVSNLLDFPNVSFFGTYVRKHFGTTPHHLRESDNPSAFIKHLPQ